MGSSNQIFNTKFQVVEDCLLGYFGTGVTSDTIVSLVHKIFNYSIESGIDSIVLAYDGNRLSSLLLNDVIGPSLTNLESKHFVIDRLCTLPELDWAVNENKSKTLGIYISTSELVPNPIFIYFRSNDKKINQANIVKEILKRSAKVEVHNVDIDVTEHKTQKLNVDGFIKWLKDKELFIEFNKDRRLSIDGMFGSVEPTINNLRTEYGFILDYYNHISDIPRILNYVAKPTGSFLGWYAPFAASNKNEFFFAINDTGSCIGVWDIKQNVELSKNSVSMLLLTYLKTYQGKTGTVLISKMLSDRVVKLAKKLGLSVKRIDSGVCSLQKNIELYKDSIFYADEEGRYWFKGAPLSGNPITVISYLINLAALTNLSLGEMVDELMKTYVKREFQSNHIMLSKRYSSRELLTAFISERFEKTIIKESITKFFSFFKLQDGSSIAIKDNICENIIETYIEAESIVMVKHVTDIINEYISQLDSDNV